MIQRYDIVPKKGRGGILFCKEAPNDSGKYIRYTDYKTKTSAMCEADSNAVLADVRAGVKELIDMINKIPCSCYISYDYQEFNPKCVRCNFINWSLVKKVSEHFS